MSTNSSNGSNGRFDRSKGTANEGTAYLYRGLGRLTSQPVESLDQEILIQELDRWLQKNTPNQSCPAHPDVPITLDRESTMRHARRWGNSEEISFVAQYTPCENCIRNYLDACGVSAALTHCTLDSWTPDSKEAETQLAAVKEYTIAQRGFLFLLGSVGLGKSHLAVGAMRIMAPHRGRGSGLFIKQSELLRELRATYRDINAKDPVPKCKEAGVLVLDEMGVSSGGKDEWPMLHDILDHRYRSRLPTIMTSNLTWEALSELVGDRLSDRFRECTFRVLTFSGDSKRSIARERYFAR